MHILITANSTWNIWNFRRSLLAKLIAEGCTVTVLAPPDASTDSIEAAGCRYVPLAMNVKGLNPLEDLQLIHRFRTAFRRERPDVILSFTIKNNIFGAIAAKTTGHPFVPTVTGLGTAFLSGRLLKAVSEYLYKTAFRRLPVVFFQNGDDRKLFLDRRIIKAEQGRVIPGSGIDLEHFQPHPMPAAEAPPVFLLVARLLRDKGVYEFAEAARHLKTSGVKARFQLLGESDAQNRSAIDAATLNAWVEEGLLEYLGAVSDVRPIMAAASCIVLPSYREGAPRTLIEAAAMARPLIATDVPGCRAVVDPDVTGFLCDVKSSSSLASAMERFLHLSHEARTRMGAAGRAKIEREFDQRRVIDAYWDVLGHLQSHTSPS